ncbi:MAG: hypothetical protein VXZ82_16770 [Planctomycetota bacterium]|nr:hypothetical protein [Planctomycetota bacterium]
METLNVGQHYMGCVGRMAMAELLSRDESDKHNVRSFLQANRFVLEPNMVEGIKDGSLKSSTSVKATPRMILATL